jgi:rhamnogalacturonan endolyase
MAAPPSPASSSSTIPRPPPRNSRTSPSASRTPTTPAIPAASSLRGGNGNIVTWAHDGNYYQFWTDGAEDGRFTIANVRPGHYTLHAFADGVLGEYAKVDINVEAGKKIDLGKLDWQPVRYGKQIWEIGYPDRIADKFYKGDGANYWLWGWPLRYGDLFPNDITYTIGKSDYHKDWFFEEVPHSDTEAWKNPDAKDPSTSASAGSRSRPVRPTPGRSGVTATRNNLDRQVHHAQGQQGPGRRAHRPRRR